MDFNWFFRKGRHDFYNSEFFSAKEHIGEDKEKEDISSFGFSNKDPSLNIEQSYFGMFEQMDDMLNRMFTSFTPFDSIKSKENQRELDPRSLMLKDPYSKDCNQYPKDIKLIDSTEHKELIEPANHNQLIDIDIEGQMKGLLLDDEFSNSFFPATQSYKNQSNFVETIDLPDGSFVKRVTVNDGQGFKNVHVMQIFRPKFNIQSDDEISKLEKSWASVRNKTIYHPVNAENLDPKVNSSPGDPSYLSLFKKFFGI